MTPRATRGPAPAPAPLSGGRLVSAVFLLALGYVILGRLGLSLAIEPGFSSAFFPPTGLVLGALLVYGWRLWPGASIGAFALNFMLLAPESTPGLAALAAAGASVGVTLQAVLAWRLLGGVAPRLTDLPEVAKFILIAAALASLVSPSFGVAAFQGGGFGEGSALLQWGTWWVGDALSVVLFTPIVLALCAEPRASWRRRRVAIVAPLLIAFALAAVIYDGARRTIAERSHADLERSAMSLAASLSQAVSLHLQLVQSTADLFRASEHVSAEEFEVFTRTGLERSDALRAIEWVPRVPAEDWARVQSEARAEHADYVLREYVDGEWVQRETPSDEVAYVVRYVLPLGGNESALGLNVASQPARLRALHRAEASESTQASEIIQLTQGGRGVLFFEPVFAHDDDGPLDTIQGHTLAVVDIDELREAAFAGQPDEELSIRIVDADAPLASRGIERELAVRTVGWRLQVTRRQGAEVADAAEVWLVLFASLLFCALLAGFLLVVTGQGERVAGLTRRFRATLESAPIPILMSDADGQIVLANAATSALLGHSSVALRAMRVADLLPERLAERYEGLRAEHLAQMEAGGEVTNDVRQFSVLHADGAEIAVEIGLSPVEVDGERFVLSAIVDVRERVEREKALAEANEALISSNQELSQFAHIASHDLQSPLRSISGFVQLLSRRYSDSFDDKGRRWMDQVVRSVAKMQNLIRDVLELSNVEGRTRPFEAVDLATVATEVETSLYASLAESNASLEVGPLPVVQGDRTQLSQLFTNLIGNALRYNESESPRIRLSVLETADAGVLTLALDDNGIGIPADKRAKVFEVFRRLHGEEKYPGTGIGLAICRRVVERHRGTIAIEDSPLGGTRFVITLPRGGTADSSSAGTD